MKLPSIYFTGFPDLKKLDSISKESGLPEKILMVDYKIYINGILVIIPKGFITDLASIPWVFRLMFNPDDPRFTVAALVHDWLYALEILKRTESDKIFFAILKTEPDVKKYEERCMFWAVYLFGWITYKNHTEESVKRLRSHVGVKSMKRPIYNKISSLVKLWSDSEYYKGVRREKAIH